VVIVHETAADLMNGLRYPDAVLVGRAGEKSSVFVRKSDNGLSFKTNNEDRKRPMDVTSALLQMARLPELHYWLRSRKSHPAPDTTGSEPVLRSNGEPFGPMTAKAAQKYAAPEGAKTADDAYDAIQARLAKTAGLVVPSRNGQHKPKT